MFFSPKIAIPVALGVTGVTAATAATISTGVFSSKKCWYDGEEPGSFLKEVEEVLQKNYPDKDNSEVKDLIKSLCTVDPGISLYDFEEKFGDEDYNNVLKLLGKKWFEVKQTQNQ